MTEKEWTASIALWLQKALSEASYEICRIEVGKRIPYGYEIRSYDMDDPESNVNRYETDLLIFDRESELCWKPRVIIEAKNGENFNS